MDYKTIDEAFEAGRQQGLKQERALWELSALHEDPETMIKYTSSSDHVITTTTPRVIFDQRVPTDFINEFLRRMAKGHIRVMDAKGNELKVYYDRGW